MPVAIPAIIAAVAAGGAFAATATVGILGLSILSSAIVIGVSTFALNVLGGLMSPKPSSDGTNSSLSGPQTAQTKQPVTDRRFIYGEVQVSGAIVFFGNSGPGGVAPITADGTAPPAGTTETLHLIIVLATHEVDAIDTIYFDSDPIHNDQIAADGQVIGGKYATAARIRKHLGTDTQPVDDYFLAEFGSLGIDENFTLSGCAYLYVLINASPTLFSGGVPDISAWVRGKKLYDPRTGMTVWNPNPALAMRDYLINKRYGMSMDSARIPDSFTIAAANICEQMVPTLAIAEGVLSIDTSTGIITINDTLSQLQTGDRVQVTTDGTLPTGISAVTNYYIIVESLTVTVMHRLATSYANALAKISITISDQGSGHHTITKNAEPRYTANGTEGTSAIPSDIITDILSAMGGSLVQVAGQWIMKAASYIAPTVSLSEGDLHGPLDVQTRHSRRERFNQVQGLYISPINYGQTSTYPLVQDQTFIDEDKGSTVIAKLDLPLTSRSQTAQRIARIQLNRHRRQQTVQMTTSMAGLQLQATDTFLLSHKNYSVFTNAVMEISDFSVVARKIGNSTAITVDIICHNTDSEIYDFDETTDEIIPQKPQAVPVSSRNKITPPGAPKATEQKYVTTDGSGVKTSAVVVYAASPDSQVREYQLEYQLQGAAAWSILPRSSALTQTIFDIQPGIYNIRVKAINIFTKESDYATSTFTILGLNDIPSNVANFSAISLSDDVTLSWDQATDLDVRIAGFVRLRHTVDTVTPNWGNARDIVDQLPGITTQAHVPIIPGYYMVKFVDSVGNESAAASMIQMLNTQAINMNFLAQLTEDTTFTGTKTGMVAIDNVLRLDGTGLFDSTTGNFDSGIGNFDSGSGSPTAVSGQYYFHTYIDAGKVIKAFVSGHIKCTVYNALSFFDLRGGNFDDAPGLFDGGDLVGVSVKMSVRLTNDDPAGTPTWTAWQQFVSGYFTARAFQFMIDVESDDPSYNMDISELSAAVDVPDVTASAIITTSSGALATFTLGSTFTQPPIIVGIIDDAQAGDIMSIPQANITASNFKAGVLNSGLFVVRNVTYFARGY